MLVFNGALFFPFINSDCMLYKRSDLARIMTTDYANIINGVMWVQVVLAILLIGLRMYTRYYVMHSTGWDDIIMLVNLVDIFWHFL